MEDKVSAQVSMRQRTSLLNWCTAWWHILTWAWDSTSGGRFNNCYRGGEGGGEGGGGKEDIHVLLTEWRRKIKRKTHARTKGQGMETNPPHALKTGVSVARWNLHMLINKQVLSPLVALDLHGLLLRQKMEGTLEMGPYPWRGLVNRWNSHTFITPISRCWTTGHFSLWWRMNTPCSVSTHNFICTCWVCLKSHLFNVISSLHRL